MAKLRSVLIMAGGTGGHVFPGLAVAKKLREQGVEVNWLGTQKGLEAKLVPNAGIPLHFISISGLRGKKLKNLLLAPFTLTLAIFQAIKIIHRLKPDVVLGMGGFVSGPGGIASFILRVPLVIHEQNAKPGMTNKWLALLARKILEGFPDTFSKRTNVITTGNPVRAEIFQLPRSKDQFDAARPLHLLVIGGSLGAAAINELVPKALAKLSPQERPDVLHQTGEKHFAETEQFYAKENVKGEIKPFITAMDKAYQWADLVLCRAGALTVAELCAAGLGAILVPFPHAVDDHQTANAGFMVKNQAALLIQQGDLTADRLAEVLRDFNSKREKCFFMAQSAYNSRKMDATEHVLKVCEEICH